MKLEISCKAKSIPLFYRMGTLSFIKEALAKSDPAYLAKVFSKDNQVRPFAYSVFLKNFQINEQEIQLEEFTVTVSSGDMEFMLHIFNGFQSIKEYNYMGHKWELVGIRMLEERQITSSKVIFKTRSPLLIESKLGKPVHPDDSGYEQEFNYYANNVALACIGRPLKKTLIVKPIQMKKVVIKESNRLFRESDNAKENLYFTAYKGTLYVEGDPEDLMCLYQYGISKRRSWGFGLLEIDMEEVN